MRIAFVGKGGSGKTTLSALFISHINKKYPVLAIDADLNMHLGPLLGFETEISAEKHISHPKATAEIKTHLKGNNQRIKKLSHFRKTTPPATGSNFVTLNNPRDPILARFCAGNEKLRILTVGTYDADEIGTSCYHNNLAILENILSHLIDTSGIAVADMVAGVDAFANTLHAQFDLLVLVVEPTRRGIEVFEQYRKLASEAEVYDFLFVVGNKIRSATDIEFFKKHIPQEKFLGVLMESEYLRHKDQEGGRLDAELLEVENKQLLQTIEKKLISAAPNYQTRLQKLFDLHQKYVSQDSIRERFGDLTEQIDTSFNVEEFIRDHGHSREKE